MSQEIPAGFRRITVNYLVSLVINNGTGEEAHVGLLWRKGLKRSPPVTQYSAIGGGALVTREGLEYLESIGGRTEQDSLDARFFIPEERIIEAAERFRTDPNLLIDGLLHELQGELCGDELGLGPIIPSERLANIREMPLGWAIMAGSPILRPDPNGRAREQDATSERLIRGFKLYVPPDVWEAMLVHPSIRRFTAEEVARTEVGLVVATANDGVTRIGNNMFLPSAFTE